MIEWREGGGAGKVDIRLPGKGNTQGARRFHQIISMIKWIWTSRLSIKPSWEGGGGVLGDQKGEYGPDFRTHEPGFGFRASDSLCVS